MNSESGHQPDSRKPNSLRNLACDVEYPGGNFFLHKFVLDNSDPNHSGSENYINAVLMCMSDAPGIIVNAFNDNDYTALHLAVLKNNPLMVKKLLSCLLYINVNVRPLGEKTVLHIAAEIGNLFIIQELLEKGASVDDENEDEETALCIAAKLEHLDVIKLLVSKGADVNYKALYSNPLFNAALSGNLDAVIFLVNSGAHVSIRDVWRRTPLHAAASSGCLKVAEFLMSNRANINAKDQIGETPSHYAASGGNLEILKFFKDKGADWHVESTIGRSLLHYAAKQSLELTSFLIDQGADIDARDDSGATPLYNAVLSFEPNLEILELLISKGADIKAVNRDLKTMLHRAVTGPVLSHCTYLIDQSASDAVEKGGMSLRNAISCVRSRLQIVEFLIIKGADLNAVDKYGKTPLHDAVNGEIAAFLLDQGADVHAIDRNGWTPLHFAVYEGCVGVLRALISKGADMNARNGDGNTPLDLARKTKRQFCIDALQNVG